jgi:hypothetical protein
MEQKSCLPLKIINITGKIVNNFIYSPVYYIDTIDRNPITNLGNHGPRI